MRSLVIIALGCFLAGNLAACSGDHAAGTSVVPQTASSQSEAQKPTGKLRHKHSGCTPDSYGYCVVHLGGSHGNKVDCWEDDGLNHFYYTPITSPVELYYNNVDQGTYTLTTTNWNCPVETSQSWSPGDPAVVTGDPNLP